MQSLKEQKISVSPLSTMLDAVEIVESANNEKKQELIKRYPQYQHLMERLNFVSINIIKAHETFFHELLAKPDLDACALLNLSDEHLYFILDRCFILAELSCNNLLNPVLKSDYSTLKLLKEHADSFINLIKHILPLELFLSASSNTQLLCLKNADKCISLHHKLGKDWSKFFAIPEHVLESLLFCLDSESPEKFDIIYSEELAQAIYDGLNHHPMEKTSLLLHEGDAIMQFCESMHVDLSQFVRIQHGFMKYCLDHQTSWKQFAQHIPFEHWPESQLVLEMQLNNIDTLLHPNAILLRQHAKLIPFNELLSLAPNKIHVVINHLTDIVLILEKSGFGFEQLMTLDNDKIMFLIQNSSKNFALIQFKVLSFQNLIELPLEFLQIVFKYVDTTIQICAWPIRPAIQGSPIPSLPLMTPMEAFSCHESLKNFNELLEQKISKVQEDIQRLEQELAVKEASSSSTSISILTSKSSGDSRHLIDSKIISQKKELDYLRDKIAKFHQDPHFKEILFINGCRLVNLYYSNIHFCEILRHYPCLAIDCLLHDEALRRLLNPKMHLGLDTLNNLRESVKDSFIQYSDKIACLILEKNTPKEKLLAANAAQIAQLCNFNY